MAKETIIRATPTAIPVVAIRTIGLENWLLSPLLMMREAMNPEILNLGV
jgi:hypothetical protein